VMPCSIVIIYQCEDEGSMVLQNVGILSQYYTALQIRRPWLVSSLLWKPEILQHLMCLFLLFYTLQGILVNIF